MERDRLVSEQTGLQASLERPRPDLEPDNSTLVVDISLTSNRRCFGPESASFQNEFAGCAPHSRADRCGPSCACDGACHLDDSENSEHQHHKDETAATSQHRDGCGAPFNHSPLHRPCSPSATHSAGHASDPGPRQCLGEHRESRPARKSLGAQPTFPGAASGTVSAVSRGSGGSDGQRELFISESDLINLKCGARSAGDDGLGGDLPRPESEPRQLETEQQPSSGQSCLSPGE